MIVVYGDPAPQGSKRYLGETKAGRGIIVESNPRTRPWRADVSAAARAVLDKEPQEPFACAVGVRMAFSFARPKSVRFTKRPYPSIAPDLSKLVRSTEDALSAAGVWKDDALVIWLMASKVYCGEDPSALTTPGCTIIVRPLLPSEAVEGTPLP